MLKLRSDHSFFWYCLAFYHHTLRTFLKLCGVFPQQLCWGSLDFIFKFVYFSLEILDYFFCWHLEDKLKLFTCGFVIFYVDMQERTFTAHAISKRLVDVPSIFHFSLGKLANGGNSRQIYLILFPGSLFELWQLYLWDVFLVIDCFFQNRSVFLLYYHL